MLSRLAKSGSSLMLLLSIAIAVSACGRRGPLEPPPSEQVVGIDEVTGEEKTAPVPTKPNRPFLLDPLL